MVTIHVDGREHEVREGQNLLQAILGLGYDLPYFCWHPALGSVGACRQCAVKQFRDADDTTGMIIMACMTPVSNDLRISIDDPEAKAFRASVIGWLMVNHPHDCPVCDEGGECHLQDMTVMAGHTRREYRFTKRTFRNQDLGPFLNHEMNRCIQCYRCVRFYRDYAGGRDFNVFGSRNRVYFGRFDDGVLSSPFSGNLAEICPTGVFTDKTFKAHSVRKWDLQSAPSVCEHCGLGCNTLPGERNGALRRVRNRYHGEINRYFLCDRGRFGYEYVNSPRRVTEPSIRDNGGVASVSADRAVARVAAVLGDGRTIGIGSPTASLEANFALRRLVGPESFFMGVDGDEAAQLRTAVDLLRNGPVRTPTLREVEATDAVLILGVDPTNTAPLLDLALRQAVLNAPKQRARELDIPSWNDAVVRLIVDRRRGPLYIAASSATGLDELATGIGRAAPQEVARFGFAVAELIDPDAPGARDLPLGIAHLAGPAAAALEGATAPLIVSGVGSGGPATLHAAANVARALARTNPATTLCLVVPDCNSVGIGLFGAEDLTAAVAAATQGGIRTVIVLEPELSTRGRREALAALLETVPHTVLLAHLEGPMTERAEIVLPAATFAESAGTVVNNEGRAQRFFQVFIPDGDIRPSWRWLQRIAAHGGNAASVAWNGFNDVGAALADEIPVFGPITGLTPPLTDDPQRPIPRQSHRVSGRTAVNAHRQIREPRPPRDDESPLAFSMEGSPRRPPPGLITRYWSPGWNSVQALTGFQAEVGGPLRGGDPGVRLLEPTSDAEGDYYQETPRTSGPKPGEWLLIELPHLLGSGPLSLETPGVKELAPEPYVAMNPDDATGLGAEDGDAVEIEIRGSALRVRIKTDPELPIGCAGFPAGLPALMELPAGRWAVIRRVP